MEKLVEDSHHGGAVIIEVFPEAEDGHALLVGPGVFAHGSRGEVWCREGWSKLEEVQRMLELARGGQ